MLSDIILKLIKNTSTILSGDVVEALVFAKNKEKKDSEAGLTFDVVLKNLELAKHKQSPICQDTGFPSFFVTVSKDLEISSFEIEDQIREGIKKATEKGYLRPNAVDSISGQNSGTNLGDNFPKIIFEKSEKVDNLKIDLLLKGGGSENVSGQISLPVQTDFGLASRDFDGIKKAVLQVVRDAKGKGCAPGMLGIHIGSDRAGGYQYAKKDLLRKIGEENENEELKKLEAEILKEVNELGIGPMGFGGKTTILDTVISSSHRHPASFFVTVAYSCWASRRGFVTLDESQNILENSFDEQGEIDKVDLNLNNLKKVSFPTSEEEIKDLRVGDVVLVNGKIFTGRDRIHAFAMKNDLKKDLKNSAIYHCGPVVLQKESGGWEISAAGPTTSVREEAYQADFIKKTGVRAVIGKGGMGQKTSEALQRYGAVYLHAIGGAAAFYAESIKEVCGVDYLDFGTPEAMWELSVEDFLCVVTMDSFGGVK